MRAKMTPVAEQLELLPREPAAVQIFGKERSHVSSTFADNMKLPIHRWFRYSAGFSAQWVSEVVTDAARQNTVTLFDPFAGSGTTLLVGQQCGVRSAGIEAHPFVARIARTKLLWQEDDELFCRFAYSVLSRAKKEGGGTEGYSGLIYKCFPDDILGELDAIKRAWLSVADGSAASELTWLALTAILRICSPVGTSNMELIQPKKRKLSSLRPFAAFPAQVDLMLLDMQSVQRRAGRAAAAIHQDDARVCRDIDDDYANLVITSPPYVNNFDYADATRLEMTFWGEVAGWADLHQKVRRHLIPSCAQHMSYVHQDLDHLLRDGTVLPIIPELREVCERLAEERVLHGGKKNYHLETIP